MTRVLPDVFKKTVKRKSSDSSDVKEIKKESVEVKQHKKIKSRDSCESSQEQYKSLTDDLPLNINKLSEARKIMLMQENKSKQEHVQMSDDNFFDIPSLSEVHASSETELKTIERQIKDVKSRLGLIVNSDSDEDCLNIKAEPGTTI